MVIPGAVKVCGPNSACLGNAAGSQLLPLLLPLLRMCRWPCSSVDGLIIWAARCSCSAAYLADIQARPMPLLLSHAGQEPAGAERCGGQGATTFIPSPSARRDARSCQQHTPIS